MRDKIMPSKNTMKLNPTKVSFALFLLLASQTTQAGDWPQWRGQNRDGKSTDTGLLQTWPDSGPQLQWKSGGLGRGYAGVSVVGARLYTMGDKTDGNYLMALNADGGKPVWSVKVGKVGAPGWGNFAGPRCQPTVAGGFVFSVDQWGELVCVSAADGQELWRKNYEKDFSAKRPEWGFAESPLVDGNQVIVTPGGGQGAIVALNKKTGEVLWRTKGFTDEAQYSSVVTAEIGGVHQFVQLTMASVVGGFAPRRFPVVEGGAQGQCGGHSDASGGGRFGLCDFWL
jgi:outer membrane protein assembly factor BamB